MHQIMQQGGAVASSFMVNMDSLLFGHSTLQRLEVAITPNIKEQSGVILLQCHALGHKSGRELQVAISCERAAIWRQTTAVAVETLLTSMRERGQEYFLDTPLMQLRLEGVEREREITSQLERRYRVTVFEVSRWFYRGKGGVMVAQGQQVRR